MRYAIICICCSSLSFERISIYNLFFLLSLMSLCLELIYLLECGLDLLDYQLLAVAGAPYDTLEEVIGIRDLNGLGSLKDFGVEYREVPVCFSLPCQ